MLAAAGLAVGIGVLLLGASPASAHSPSVTAEAVCADGGGFDITFTSTAWAGFPDDPNSRSNPDILISVIIDGGAPIPVASGAYNAGNNYSFSGSFFVPASATSVVVSASAMGVWGSGEPGNGWTEYSGPVSLPTDCEPPPPVFGGCTPGFWKNHTSAWQGFSPSQSTASVFSGATAYGLGTRTLLQSLDGGGGSGLTGAAKILLRAGTAAVLNASHSDVDYPRTAGAIIADVNAALASGNRATILALAGALDADNNLGCDNPGNGGEEPPPPPPQ